MKPELGGFLQDKVVVSPGTVDNLSQSVGEHSAFVDR